MSIPNTMLAAILVEQKKPLAIERVTLPEKLDYGQVCVKVNYTGICGSQIGEIDGVKGPDRYLPHLLGHEGAGQVIEVGPGVSHISPGSKVVMHWRKGQGIDAKPPVYKWSGKNLNAGFVTTFNEYAVVSENRVTAIPEDFALDIAPLLGCAVTTAFGVITNNAKLKIGESVVVFGVGGVGLNAVQAAAMTSAYPVIAVDLHVNKLEMARRFGATHLVNSAQVEPGVEIQKILKQEYADVVVETTGNTAIMAMAYELAKPQGRVILVGVPNKGDNISIHSLPLHFGKILTGSHGGEANPTLDIPKYVRLYNVGKLKLKELITDRFNFNEINVAIEKMRAGEIAGRCLVKIGK